MDGCTDRWIAFARSVDELIDARRRDGGTGGMAPHRGLREVWNERHWRGLEPVLADISEILRSGDADLTEWLKIQSEDTATKQKGRQDLASKETWMTKAVAHLESRLRNPDDDFDEVFETLERAFSRPITPFIRTQLEDAIASVQERLADDLQFQQAEADRTRRKAIRNYAAERFQMAWRCMRFRRAVASSPFRRFRFVVRLLQARIRARHARAREKRALELLRKTAAACTIQRAMLAARARAYERAVRESRLRQAQHRRLFLCGRRIQRAWRLHRSLRIDAASRLQAWWRKAYAQHCRLRTQSACKLQNAWRSWRHKRFLVASKRCVTWWKLELWRRRRRFAASTIQSHYRGVLAARTTRATRKAEWRAAQELRRRQEAASTLQAHWKRITAARRDRSMRKAQFRAAQELRANAASTCAAWWRLRTRSRRQHRAAQCIQAFFRIYIVSRWQRRIEHDKARAAALLQSWWRREHENLRSLQKAAAFAAAIRIQCNYRGVLGRRRANNARKALARRSRARREREAALKLQRFVRAKCCDQTNIARDYRVDQKQSVPETSSPRPEEQEKQRETRLRENAKTLPMSRAGSGRLYGSTGSRVGSNGTEMKAPPFTQNRSRPRIYKVPERRSRVLPPVRKPVRKSAARKPVRPSRRDDTYSWSYSTQVRQQRQRQRIPQGSTISQKSQHYSHRKPLSRAHDHPGDERNEEASVRLPAIHNRKGSVAALHSPGFGAQKRWNIS